MSECECCGNDGRYWNCWKCDKNTCVQCVWYSSCLICAKDDFMLTEIEKDRLKMIYALDGHQYKKYLQEFQNLK